MLPAVITVRKRWFMGMYIGTIIIPTVLSAVFPVTKRWFMGVHFGTPRVPPPDFRLHRTNLKNIFGEKIFLGNNFWETSMYFQKSGVYSQSTNIHSQSVWVS